MIQELVCPHTDLTAQRPLKAPTNSLRVTRRAIERHLHGGASAHQAPNHENKHKLSQTPNSDRHHSEKNAHVSHWILLCPHTAYSAENDQNKRRSRHSDRGTQLDCPDQPHAPRSKIRIQARRILQPPQNQVLRFMFSCSAS
jgi:hypothetical protein